MKIYSLSHMFDDSGNNLVRHAFPKRAKDLWEKLAPGDQIEFEWGEGDAGLPHADFVPTTLSVFIGTTNLARQVKEKFAPSSISQVVVVDGEDQKLCMLRPKNFTMEDELLDHLFMLHPTMRGLLGTEVFVNFWRNSKLTGLGIREVGELPDDRFSRIDGNH